MNISNQLRENFVFSAAAVVPFPESHHYYINHDPESKPVDLRDPELMRSLRKVNDVSKVKWRIEGSVFGTTYYATPVFLLPSLPPLQIDVSVPDQLDWDSELWGVLDACESVHVHDSRVSDLGISRYLARVLENWSDDYPDFEKVYRNLPFGSSIVIETIRLELSEIRINFKPNDELCSHLLTASSLWKMWGFMARDMLPSIKIQDLKFVRRLYSSVCLVQHGGKDMVFKSDTRSPSGIYHEIKVLLSLPPHQNIVGPPKGLVTISTNSSGDDLICGFLLQYYELGSMEKALPRILNSGSLHLHDQMRWSRELASALRHIHSQPGMFHSDLKMDNIVLRSVEGGRNSIVLVDFEQGRNLYTWAPPEVFYVEWIAELGYRDIARNDSLTDEMMVEYREIINQHFRSRGITDPLRFKQLDYDNPEHGWYYPWTLSTPEEQEAGAVYCLGRALWCIFEGIGDTSNVLGRSYASDANSEREFPSFTYRTPDKVQALIRRCTSGAREWKDAGPLGLFRRGGKVYPRGRTGVKGEPLASVKETITAIRDVWQLEIEKAKKYLQARERLFSGRANTDDRELLGYLDRPKLEDVLKFFEDFQLSESKPQSGF